MDYFFLFLVLFPIIGIAQLKSSAEIQTQVLFSTNEEHPFWLYVNKRGRIVKNANFSGLISGKLTYDLDENSSLEIGLSALFVDRIDNKILIDEAYLEYKNDWIKIVAGKTQEEELYNGLSAVNRNILWSLNAQPLSGISIRTRRPIYFTKNKIMGAKISWNENFMGGQEFVRHTKVHSKSFHFVYNHSNTLKISAGIQHVAQWGGTSDVHGKQPTSFSDYLRVVTGREGEENALITDQQNVFGNHLGSYELYLDKEFSHFNLRLIYNSIFEDGSGSRLANLPDGRYGIYLNNLDDKTWINSFIYEFYYTKNQSQTVPHLFDGYFDHRIYRSGWTYQSNVIGLPFITTNTYKKYVDGEYPEKIGNNLLNVHHLGLSGFLNKRKAYKLLLSYRKNYGHYRNTGPMEYEYYSNSDSRGERILPRTILSTFFEISLFELPVKLNILMSADFSKEENTLGIGLNLSKKF